MSSRLILHTMITITVTSLIVHQVTGSFVPKGRKCRLQEQQCDIMHPDKSCCPGTSCGVRMINNNLVNICLICNDIGSPCGGDKGSCCKGLRCQKITQMTSMCNPIDYRFATDHDSDI